MMVERPHLILWLLLPALSVSTFACAESSLPPLAVGLMSELSGPSAPNGIACREGYEVARSLFAPSDKVGSRSINFMFSDHRAEPKVAVAELEKLSAHDGIIALFSNRANVSLALNPISRRKKIPFFGLVSAADFIPDNPYAFRFSPSPTKEAALLAEKSFDLGKRRAAIIVLEDDYPLSIGRVFKTRFHELGGEIVFSDTIREGESEFLSIISRMKSTNPDLLLLNASIGELGVLIKRVREQGLNEQIVSNFWASYQSVIDTAGKFNIDGTLYVTIDTNRPVFLQRLKAQFGHENPSSVTYMCYSGVATFLTLLKEDPTIDSAAAVFDALNAHSSVELPDELLPMVGREAQYRLAIGVIRDGKRSILESR